MEHYISKSALVAEIERRLKETESMQPKFDQFWAGQISSFKGVLKILDTLEVKEVDSTDTFIEKACEWLENHNDYQRVLDDGRGVRFDMTQCVIDFRKAMKGE